MRPYPQPLEQIPVWGGLAAPAAPDDAPTGIDALLTGLNTDQRRAVTHGTGRSWSSRGPGRARRR